MNDFTPSFFDSCSAKPEIWTNVSKDDDYESVFKNYYLKSNFYVMSKKKKIKLRLLILNQHAIFYYKVNYN